MAYQGGNQDDASLTQKVKSHLPGTHENRERKQGGDYDNTSGLDSGYGNQDTGYGSQTTAGNTGSYQGQTGKITGNQGLSSPADYDTTGVNTGYSSGSVGGYGTPATGSDFNTGSGGNTGIGGNTGVGTGQQRQHVVDYGVDQKTGYGTGTGEGADFDTGRVVGSGQGGYTGGNTGTTGAYTGTGGDFDNTRTGGSSGNDDDNSGMSLGEKIKSKIPGTQVYKETHGKA